MTDITTVAQKQLEQIRTDGKAFIGREQAIQHLEGKPLTHKEAILAMCYICSGMHSDGLTKCTSHECPLYPKTPYPADPVPKSMKLTRQRDPNAPKKVLSPEHLAKLAAGREARLIARREAKKQKELAKAKAVFEANGISIPEVNEVVTPEVTGSGTSEVLAASKMAPIAAAVV